jgi:hypothetical protein
MKRLAISLTACALLAVFALTATSAQDDDPDDTPEPEWRYHGVIQDVDLDFLVQAYANESGRTVVYQPQQLRHTFSFTAPHTGASYSAHSLLQTGLSQFRMALVDEGGMDVIFRLLRPCGTLRPCLTKRRWRRPPR